MEEILHDQKDGCITLNGWNPLNNEMNHLSTGAGFRNHPQQSPIKTGSPGIWWSLTGQRAQGLPMISSKILNALILGKIPRKLT